MSDWRQHITGDPGEPRKPAVTGTDVEVSAVLRLLGDGWTVERVISRFPQITPEDVHACIEYAAEILERERVRAKIRRGIEDVDAGRVVPAEQVWRELDAKFGPDTLEGEDDEP